MTTDTATKWDWVWRWQAVIPAAFGWAAVWLAVAALWNAVFGA